jgi:hypothetical protein
MSPDVTPTPYAEHQKSVYPAIRHLLTSEFK